MRGELKGMGPGRQGIRVTHYITFEQFRGFHTDQ